MLSGGGPSSGGRESRAFTARTEPITDEAVGAGKTKLTATQGSHC